ncbi:MAG: ATP-binding protein [Peptococcaceae bacterium]|jgi:predicted AAA+ superfamily ATPase|nr:ATP-binding protein [Peptococcaceae bacterium]
MLYRKMYEKLLNWKNNRPKKALLLTGARQIGKTFLIREFGRQNYESLAEINFITEPSAALIFGGDLSVGTLMTNLTAYFRAPLTPGKTLVFFDEIQECPAARTAMKFLVEDGRFDYIESGSLLGVNYKEVQSYPVGYEETLQMYPMDFEEFALANGAQRETIAYLKERFDQKAPVSEAVHQTMKELFRYFVIVGGMPAAAQSFVDTRDMGEVLRIQNDILAMYRQDIAKYARNDKAKIKDIFDRVPAELNTRNRRFKLSDISKTARVNRYENSFVWLADAGVALPCYSVSEPKVPLRLNERSGLFRLYMNDTGLLCAASMENVQFDILAGDLTVNMGGILENTFAQLFRANGFELRYLNRKNIGEIDFILQRGKNVVPVEIKSGSGYESHAALNNALSVPEWGLGEAYVFCLGNVLARDKITYLPWYMVMFFEQERLPEHLIVEVDLKNLT